MAITIKKTENDGSVHEITFGSTLEATKALSALFDVELSENVQRQESRRALNDAIRSQFQRGRSTSNPQALIESARASNRWQGE